MNLDPNDWYPYKKILGHRVTLGEGSHLGTKEKMAMQKPKGKTS